MKISTSVIGLLTVMNRRAPTSTAFQPHALTPCTSNKAYTHIGRLFSSSSERTSVSTESIMNIEIEGPALPPIPANTKRLFMVRHGEVINPGGDRPVYYGAMDVSLSSLGEKEAMVAAEYLKQFNLQHVAASPLSRAKFGANEVLSRQKNNQENKDLDTNIKIYEGFTELERGSWCGKTKDEIGSDMMARFDACDETATPEGGESYPQLKQRVLAARDELLEITDRGKASVVVSHLQVTRSMLSDALSIPTEEMYKFKVATASVACVDFNTENGEQTVHFQNFKPDVGLSSSKDGAN